MLRISETCYAALLLLTLPLAPACGGDDAPALVSLKNDFNNPAAPAQPPWTICHASYGGVVFDKVLLGQTSAARSVPAGLAPVLMVGAWADPDCKPERCLPLATKIDEETLPGQQRPGTVGYPYDGVQSRIDPANDEIQVKSPGMMLGYYKEPEQTRQAFTGDGWLRTGDKGVLDEEGSLRISGRVKDLFKTSKGKYVTPAPIEDKLVMHAAVEACCVTGANLGQPLGILMLNVEASQRSAVAAERSALEASLAAHLEAVNALLDPHERLDCLVVVTQPWTVESGLITPTFKVRRNRIEDVYASHYERWVVERRTVIWHEG